MPGNIVLILGDQLTVDNPALPELDRARDRVLMIEAPGEAAYVWSHKARIALFLAAMRHFASGLRRRGYALDYIELDARGGSGFAARLLKYLRARKPCRLRVCEPGEYRMLAAIQDACKAADVALDVRPDTHFLCSRQEFARWAGDSKILRMEFFYRHMRRETDVLMARGKPAGGRWNFDTENRAAFGKRGPGKVPAPPRFKPDAVTRKVIALVERRFKDHPGSLEHFGWPVTRGQALRALRAFVADRLPNFGRHQDAMWDGAPFLWHSLLSSSLNLKLLDPREVIEAAVDAWRAKRAPLAGVEGFVRQILGWREFIRGVYWLDMPGLARANHFRHKRALPRFYWTGDTGMRCLGQAISQTLEHGYAHHIQRLMLTGNFALLAEIEPRQVCDWYLAVYVDAVEWAELPNTAGMALYANGGRFTSKPYVSTGAYVKRMSNHCGACRYDPGVRSGSGACPFTTLYWNFIAQHERELARNPRTVLMARNLSRLPAGERGEIRRTAQRMLDDLDAL